MQPLRRLSPRAPAIAADYRGLPRLSPADTPTGLGLPGVGELILRNLLLILAITLAGLTITWFSVKAQEPRYETVARIVLERVSAHLDETAAEVRQTVVSEAEVATELDVMRSRSYLLLVAQQLNLFADPDFNPFATDEDDPADPTVEAQEAVLAKLLSTFWLTAAPRSLTIDIHVADTDAQRAADIANALAQTFISQSVEVQQGGLREMAQFLEERLTKVRSNLEEAELESATWIRFNQLDDPALRSGLLSDLDRVTAQIAIAGTDAQALAQLRAEQERIDAALRDWSQAELRRVRMDRYLDTLRAREGLFSNRYDALLAQLSILAPSARQMSVAHVPSTPTAPNLKTAMAGGLVGSLAIGFVAAMLRASVDRRVWTGQAAGAGLDTLGRVPRVGRRAARGGPEAVPRALEDAVRPILTSIRLRRAQQGPLVVLLGSAGRGEGRSTLALAMAASAAAEGDCALVLDLEAEGHGAAELLGLARSGLGLAAAAGNVQLLTRGIYRPMGQDGLSLFAPAAGSALPRHIFTPQPARAPGRSGPGGLLDLLCADYDLIVIDAPPILSGDACLRLAAHCDAVVILFRPSRTAAKRLRDAVGLLRRNGIEPVGLVENDA